ncbi:molybdopterin cofactor-binding domain-containing protein [Streptomyces sp. NPDC059477]|uniref:molybdopterin cofactor-binding domain-containing protein n=1 Tax=Streptomyces sp. NPDC059477 TaxID=3346847 RepID=UPI00368DEABB
MNIPPVTIMRAPADQPGSFGLACAIDKLAAELGIDPQEIRRRNFATTHPGEGLPWSGNHLEECYRTGAERIGWRRYAAAPGNHRGRRLAGGPGRAHGWPRLGACQQCEPTADLPPQRHRDRRQFHRRHRHRHA